MKKCLLKFICLFVAFAFLAACGGVGLGTERLKPEISTQKTKNKKSEEEISARPVPRLSEDVLFTLIYYVGMNRDDKMRAVILDLEDDDIEFIPDVSDFEYEILQNVSIQEAVYETEIFLWHERVITDYYFKKILGTDGKTIGYEIRPTYEQDYYGYEDPLIIKYKFNRQRVNIRIGLRPGLRR